MYCIVLYCIVLYCIRERERERERDHELGRGAEGERENPRQAPCLVQSLTLGLFSQPWDHDLS